MRYRIAAEYLDVVQGLWDSWEDDAHVADKASGRFVDPEKLHRLDHQGEFFQVRGPLNIKRSPQGQPVIFQAGASDDGRAFAARQAEVIFTHAETLEDGQANYADVKARAAGFGRHPEQLYILPGVAAIIGDTDEEAEASYLELAALESLETGFGFLSRTFNDHDFRQYDLDGPFPDVAHIGLNSQQSGSLRILKEVREEKLTLRQVVQRLATPRGAFVGSPVRVADAIQTWFEEREARTASSCSSRCRASSPASSTRSFRFSSNAGCSARTMRRAQPSARRSACPFRRTATRSCERSAAPPERSLRATATLHLTVCS